MKFEMHFTKIARVEMFNKEAVASTSTSLSAGYISEIQN